MIISYLKELFRPVRILMVYRHFRQMRLYKGLELKLGFYSSLINTKIGRKVFIGQYCIIKDCEVGANSYCNSNTIIQNSTIGKYTSIGANVTICIGAHPTNLVTTHPAFYSNNKEFETYSDSLYFNEFKKSEIGNDVWIGSNSVIMNNVTIGDGAIIAYGAVVTKNVLPYSIVGGIPAKHIKFRFDKEIINRLLEIKWWELSEVFLKQHFKLFHNPVDFIDFYDKNKAYIESFRNN